MRNAEIISCFFFTFFIMAAWLKKMERPKCFKVSLIGVCGILVVLGGFSSQYFLPPLGSSILRDWMPAPLLMIVYWQAGLFIGQPDEKFQRKLNGYDQKIFALLLRSRTFHWGYHWIAAYFEFAYLFCYPMVPLGMGVLYLSHLRIHADQYWTILLPSTYLCYVLIPFVQTLPPRMLDSGRLLPLRSSHLRNFNLWILRHWSIQLNTFPSAHVASTMAASLVLLDVEPACGMVFLIVSISIAAGAVLGRYHYAADVVLAAVLAITIHWLYAGHWG